MRNTLFVVLTTVFLTLFACTRSEAAEFAPTPEDEQIRAGLTMYPASVLAGKGLVYKDLSEPARKIKDPTANERLFADTVLRRLIEEGSPLPVCGGTDATFALSLPAEDASSQSRVLRVDKNALRAAGFRYIPLNALREWYDRHPERLKNLLGPSPTPTISPGAQKRRYALLHVRPDDAAPFVNISLPGGGGVPQGRIVSRKGDWFELELYYRFKYNGSKEPGVCAMSLCEETFQGFWKAPLDANGFPVLLPALLRDPADWKRIAAEVGRGI